MSSLLHYQRQGHGQPLVILHGLFGSLDNWNSITRQLAEHYDVISVDLRNHGRSFHAEPHDYSSMSSDVLALLDALQLESILLMGHSMGGKAAMQLAMQHSERIARLIVVDIAPVDYPRHHDDVFSGLNSLNLSELKSRSAADKALTPFIDDMSVRQFLLRSLYKNDEGKFAWRFNLQQLESDYRFISKAPEGENYAGPALFIKGANSHYLKQEYASAVTRRFPDASYKIIQDTGHWPHAEKPELFLSVVERFLAMTSEQK
ncbi:alpha/beta fold hydrolase [Pokkaliibacter sp. CJK22405]|uniref:alpha/beta fold hydrolase n=1 Tax=Pokkaliibacter sp. CJK22405 TaxID=3384615 RepID=UPI0039854233